MVLTREIREEIEFAVNQAVSQTIKSDSLINQIVNKVTEALAKTLEQKLMKVVSTVAELEQNYTDMNEKFKSMENKLEIAEKEKYEMEDKVDQMDQATRSCNLRVFSLKEKPNEITKEEIKKIINSKMSLNLTDGDISNCYRVGRKVENKTRGIFLKLNSLELKQIIYGKKKLLKGTGIVIKEDLSEARVKQVNVAIEKFGLKNVWTNNGKIYFNNSNKVHIMKTRKDFEKFL
ncbi:uncharacterized protein [Leptinotarsa decemlineata]|uniref:uncharacterized protein n=1 Tax=Leptinotarsa decemlineata TaxID=7539 RepID=UPI003D30908C